MKTGWVGKGWEEWQGNLILFKKKDRKIDWVSNEWPPVKVRILTEEEYKALLNPPFIGVSDKTVRRLIKEGVVVQD